MKLVEDQDLNMVGPLQIINLTIKKGTKQALDAVKLCEVIG